MEFLNPGFLGSQAAFRKSFFIPIQANWDTDAAERLKRLTAPFILRRLKTDKNVIDDLPDKIEAKVFCTLTKEQASLYEAVVRDAAEALDSTDGIQRKGVVLATLSKLKQVCNHPAHFLGDNSAVAGRSGKLARLTEMVEEILATGDRALIFSQFTEMGEILRRYLQDSFGREVLFLHGGVSKKLRDRMVERFQAEGGRSVTVRVVSQSRGYRSEPDPRRPCLSLRPVVEPRRGKPGNGSCPPDRSEEQGAGPQVRLRRDTRRTHRRNDRKQEGNLGKCDRCGGELADRVVYRGTQATFLTRQKCDGRINDEEPASCHGGTTDMMVFFPPFRRPREAKGGIKAQSRRGDFGESWWAKRWIGKLESFNIGARLGRGRSYARSGQVLSITIEKGLVEAKVQGSRSRPYGVVIKVKPLSEADWRNLLEELSSQAFFAAKLLAGEMPREIEDVFKQAGLSLFPEKSGDLQTDCSCPDWSNPCKHIAAVYYLLGEEFDRNPFLIFKMRGLDREELLDGLGKGLEKAGMVQPKDGGETRPGIPDEPLDPDVAAFWKGTETH